MIAEISTARSRRLEKALSRSATFSFSIDGRDPACKLVQELTTDVYGWRWDDRWGTDVCLFRGLVTQSQDTLSEQADTVNFTCHDYFAMLDRRHVVQGPWNFSNDQDDIVGALVHTAISSAADGWTAPNRTPFFPADYLPLWVWPSYPDGQHRPPSGRVRDRSYLAGQLYGEAITNLSNVIDGFDFDVMPGAQWNDPVDHLRLFYPYQGILRDDCPLIYGSSVSSLSRSINSANYANYVRIIGGHVSEQASQDLPPPFAERWYNDSGASSPLGPPAGPVPIGLWMSVENAADTSRQETLNEKAEGFLARSGIITPNYSLSMRPNAYTWGYPNMGDECPLVIHAGRLDVETYARVTGINYAISDDGTEAIELTVGRPAITLTELFRRGQSTLSALVRR
jgi:hypothetical protein